MKTPEVCKDCWKWKIFKKDCNYYWDLKKVCSQYETEGQKKDKKNGRDNI